MQLPAGFQILNFPIPIEKPERMFRFFYFFAPPFYNAPKQYSGKGEMPTLFLSNAKRGIRYCFLSKTRTVCRLSSKSKYNPSARCFKLMAPVLVKKTIVLP